MSLLLARLAAPGFVDISVGLPAASDFDVDTQVQRDIAATFPAASDLDVDVTAQRDIATALPAASDFDVDVTAQRDVASSFSAASDFDIDVTVQRDIDVAMSASSDFDIDAELVFVGGIVDIDFTMSAADGIAIELSKQRRQHVAHRPERRTPRDVP